MKTKLFVAMAIFGVAAFGAGCDDTTNTGGAGGATASSGSGTTKSSSGSMTTTGTMGSTSSGPACMVAGTIDPNGMAATECPKACSIVYDCGALTCGSAKVCPGFSGMAAEKTAFVGTAPTTPNGTDGTGCIQGCFSNPLLLSLVDPGHCDDTLDTLKAVNMSLKDVCENGFGMGTTSASSSSTGP